MSTDHSGPRGFRPSRARRLTASTVAALLSVCAASAAQEAEKVYLQEDAVIAGEKMHTFSAGSEAVNVVLGSFSLIVGERSLSGRDAVVWVKQRHLRQQVFRDIDVYIRGDGQRPAQVVEPDGTTTTDRVLLVVLRQQGALRARVGRHSTEAALDLPLYQQAVAMRKGLEVPTTPTTGLTGSRRPHG